MGYYTIPTTKLVSSVLSTTSTIGIPSSVYLIIPQQPSPNPHSNARALVRLPRSSMDRNAYHATYPNIGTYRIYNARIAQVELTMTLILRLAECAPLDKFMILLNLFVFDFI